MALANPGSFVLKPQREGGGMFAERSRLLRDMVIDSALQFFSLSFCL